MQLQKKNTYMRQEEQSADEKAANQGMEETKPQGPEKDGVPARDQAAPAAQPAVSSAPSDAASLGALLRSAREARGLSLADAANALKLGEDALKAIEEGRYEVFPHKAYARGFLRSFNGSGENYKAECFIFDGKKLYRRCFLYGRIDCKVE